MNRTFWATLVTLLLSTGQPLALDITSLAPIRGTPGTLVAIDGGPFSSKTQPFLGEHYVEPRIVQDNHLEFTVPLLPPGNYLLTVQDNAATAGQSFQFEVMAPTPQVSSLNPHTIDICQIDAQAEIQVNGRNFLPGAEILVNNKLIPGHVINATTLEAHLPEFQQSGVYGVMVRNPDGAISLPYSLSVNSTPEIFSVERGADFVTYYEIIIHGKNFLFNSIMVLQESESGSANRTYQQLSFVPRSDAPAEGDGRTIAPQSDRLIFVDCQTLIYQRHPYSFQNKELGLQIFNPDGGSTDLYYVSLP